MPIELALGGGNPLSHPELPKLLITLKDKGFITNITVNQGHLKTYQGLLQYLIKDELVRGVGISITNNNFKHVQPLLRVTDNLVYHLIAGVSKVEVIDMLVELGKCKILVLGYKKFGFGVAYHNPNKVDEELKRWYRYLPKYIGKCLLSFDNLAIEQLNIGRLFTKAGWERFYMGNDFVFTMYIDAVKQQYAPTSRSINRKSFSEYSLLDYFKEERKIGTV